MSHRSSLFSGLCTHLAPNFSFSPNPTRRSMAIYSLLMYLESIIIIYFDRNLLTLPTRSNASQRLKTVLAAPLDDKIV